MADKARYDRGTALSIFSSDRMEDIVALIFALLIVIGTIIFIPR